MLSDGLSTTCASTLPRAAARREHMALYKRPRSPHWQYDVTVGGKRYRGSTRCDSKTAAKAFEARFVIDTQERGFAPKPERKTLSLLAYLPTFEKWARGS